MPLSTHWRVASAAAILVLAGSSAVALAMHDEPEQSSLAYRAWPAAPLPHRTLAAHKTGAAAVGLALMNEAATACQHTQFSGIQVARWWSPGGPLAWLTAVWHRPGTQAVARMITAAPAGPRGVTPGPLDPAARSGASAWLLISAPQLAVLKAGYLLDYAGRGAVAGRQAVVVAVARPDGTLAAKYWLDARTKLPLRRQVFGDATSLVSDVSLTRLRLGPAALAGMPAANGQPWHRPLGRAAILALRLRGWPLPGALPAGMTLVGASGMSGPAGRVIGLSYTDGLSVISLFVQRGELAAAPAGWQHIAISGHQAYATDRDEQVIAWAGDGYVFTVISAAPPVTVDEAIAVLPHGEPPGLLARLARGFRRLASWVDPFR